jgi:hypothetical protein
MVLAIALAGYMSGAYGTIERAELPHFTGA